MARGLPDEETYTPHIEPEDLPRKIVPHADAQDFGAGASAALGEVGQALGQKYAADSATYASNQLAAFRTQAIDNLEKAKAAMPADQDPGNFTQNYLKAFNSQVPNLMDQTNGNPLAQRMIEKGVNDLRSNLIDHTHEWEATQRVAFRTNSLDQNLQSQTALIEAHPELASSIGSTLADQANAIGGDPSMRLSLMRKIDAQVSMAAAAGMTRQDPRGTLQALNDPTTASDRFAPVLRGLNDAQREAIRAKANEHLGDAVYSALSAGNVRGAQIALSKNEDLLDPKEAENLQRGINSQVQMNMAMHDKQQKDASDSLLKNAILMQQNGQLTDQWIEKNHNVWEPVAYEYAKKLLSGAEVKTDAHTYLSLLDRQVNGEDVRSDVMSAASQGLLDKADAGKLIEASSKETPSTYKQGLEYIKTASQVSLLEPDPAKSQSQANMVQDWNNLWKEHPEFAADPGKAEVAYRSIVGKYQVIAADKTRFTMEYPPYFPGTRMQPDMQGAKAALYNAMTTGQISQAEGARRAGLIKQWEALIQSDAQRKAAQAKAAPP